MIKNTSIITSSSYISMLLLGVAATLIGAAARNIGLSPYEISLMIMIQNLGFMVSVIISGALADTYSKPKILMIGSLILSISFLTFYSTAAFNLNLVIMFMIGAGIGTYEGVTDAMLIDIHPQKESLHININHFFVTFGSILITVYLIFLQMNWRNAVVQSGIIVFGLAILFALIKLSTRIKTTEPYLERMRILTRDKVVVVFFIATALVVGIEAGTIGILTTYLMDMRAFTQVTSKVGLVIFLLGMALGRVIIGIFAPQDKINQILLALFGASVIIYSTLFFFDLKFLTYGVIFLAGLSISALLPLMLAKAGMIYSEMAGTVLGSIKVAIPIGGILIPFAMSNLVKYWSFSLSLIIFPLSLLTAFVLIYLTTSTESKVGKSSSAD
ncbi:MAG TPA: MFS transporter [Anaerolineales bacterium]|nr:MFS transporter [Anaerolineales bacterium]